MSLGSPYRIHVAVQGYEQERIYQPAVESDADRVILLMHTERDEQAEECLRAVTDALEEEDIEVEEEEIDIFDLSNAVGAISRIILDHPEDRIKVNISTGSKITAVAGTLACMLHNAEPYYVRPESYGETTISKGVKDTALLPTYPITVPDRQLVRVLRFIADRGESGEKTVLRDINQFALEESLDAVADSNRTDVDKIYDITNSRIVEPLQERGLIKKQTIGNETRISITEKGERTLELAQSIIEDISE